MKRKDLKKCWSQGKKKNVKDKNNGLCITIIKLK